MSSFDKKEDKPVEIFCPICGYTTFVNEIDEEYTDLPREKKIQYVRTLQQGTHPVFLCSRCDNPEQSARIMDVR